MSTVSRRISSEYVSKGHPDKMADIIADAIVDGFISQDPNSRCGIEVMVKDNTVVLGGEVKSIGKVDYDNVVRNVFKEIKYPSNHNLQPENIRIINLIGRQSPEINGGVDKNDGEIGAGDQGHMWGYASNDTDVLMPLGHYLAKKIVTHVAEQPKLGPDAKSQVIVREDIDGTKEVEYILVSTMHQDTSVVELKEMIKQMIFNNEIGIPDKLFKKYIKPNIRLDVNPCGGWTIGGSISDAGITGRKIVADAYGGYSRVGGGATSGKDFSKVDRSAQYMCRYLAKNIVASGVCDTVEVGLAYAIGIPEPCSINIEMNRNNDLIPRILKYISNNIKLTPKGIIEKFDGTYSRNYILAMNGAYGYDTSDETPTIRYIDIDKNNASIEVYQTEKIYPWEATDFASELNEYIFQ